MGASRPRASDVRSPRGGRGSSRGLSAGRRLVSRRGRAPRPGSPAWSSSVRSSLGSSARRRRRWSSSSRARDGAARGRADLRRCRGGRVRRSVGRVTTGAARRPVGSAGRSCCPLTVTWSSRSRSRATARRWPSSIVRDLRDPGRSDPIFEASGFGSWSPDDRLAGQSRGAASRSSTRRPARRASPVVARREHQHPRDGLARTSGRPDGTGILAAQ